MIGDKDIQVLSSINNPAIKIALARSGNMHYQVKELKNFNHLFQRCNTGLTEEYPLIDEVMNEEVMETIARWIHTLPVAKPQAHY